LSQASETVQGFRLSPQQRRLWALQQKAGEEPFRARCAVLITGPLDPAALERALWAVVAQHEILRTTFQRLPGMKTPVQVVAAPSPLHLDRLVADDPAALLGAAPVSLDLEHGPALAAGLAALEPDRHLLVLTVAGLCADAIGLGNLVREIVSALTGEPDRELVQYADVAEVFNDLLDCEEMEAGRLYWRRLRLLALAGPVLPGEGAPAREAAVGELRAALDPRLAERIEGLLEELAAPAPAFFLAAWSALLGRLGGVPEIPVGVCFDGRSYEGLSECVGLLEKFVPVACPAAPGLSFAARVAETAQRLAEACDRQECFTWELFHDPLEGPAAPGSFGFTFAYRELPAPCLAGGLCFQILEQSVRTEPAKVELACLYRGPGRFELELRHDPTRLGAPEAACLLAQLQTLLANAVDQPRLAADALSIVGPEERARLLFDVQGTVVERGDECLQELFARQVARTPDAVAVVCEDLEVTYAELDRQANRLGRHLLGMGVAPDVPVAICLDRSLDMVVALLAVLKAGGPYLPLDPAYPEERLTFMAEDAGAAVLITTRTVHQRRPLAGRARRVLLDVDSPAIAGLSDRPLAVLASGANLAYVIYTSGSTGRPKGVMIPHSAIANRLLWMQERWPLRAGDRVLQKTSFSFDAAVWELFCPLLAGAQLVLASPGAQRDGEQLLREVRERGITVLQVVPSMFAVLLNEPQLRDCRSLRRLFCGGEALPMEWVERFWTLSVAELHNLYGPTEVSIDATHWPCMPTAQAVAPIGRPIANMRVHLLDAELDLVPTGMPGELYIGGSGLARGYFARPDLTAERFLPDPWSERPGEQLYRSGDLARRRADGTLDFLGRADDQVKIRGFRIEPGEIEAALARHPAVREVVVAVRDRESGDSRLVAYVVPNPAYTGQGQESGPLPLNRERVDQWQSVFDGMYGQMTAGDDPLFNTLGWQSSYTGTPIAEAEMREWVESTVERILAGEPRRVLEIGCGTGLLLFRIAPRCESYLATDFSAAAVQSVQRHLEEGRLPQVTVAQRLAEDFSGIPARSLDAVVLNSVVQYFPSAEYLVEVLSGAIEAVAPGGRVWIGDIRSLPLLAAFHASVQLHQAPPSMDTGALLQRIRKLVQAEEELTLHPGFFHALQRRFPRIGAVEIAVKRGWHHNELTRFRFDVTLHIGVPAPPAEPRELDWRHERLTLPAVRRLLAQEAPEELALKGIPNSRLADSIQALTLLAMPQGPRTVGALRQALPEMKEESLIDPEDLWKLAGELGYRLHVTWSPDDAEGRLDAVFRRGTVEGPPPEGAAAVTERPWSEYANNPLHGRLLRTLVPSLPGILGKELPDYMIPAAFVLLDALPRLPNGKVDRAALPDPGAIAEEREAGFAPPRTAIEEILAGLYAEVLGVPRVSTEDGFFALGGHSLIATQLVSRVRRTFQVDLPLIALFESPRVIELAARIDMAIRLGHGIEEPPLARAPREGDLPLSFAQQRLWFLAQLDPESPAYNVPAAARIRGALDTVTLARTLAEIVRRHEMLRTTFEVRNGGPVQIVAPAVAQRLPRLDLSGLSEAPREAEVRRLILEEARRPFDLRRGPLVRTALIRMGAGEHLLLVTMHHIVSDGWSSGIFVREFATLYRSFVAGEASPLAAPALQYADFACWQRLWLTGAVMERQLAYWRRQLAGMPPGLALHADRPRPPVQTFRGALASAQLPDTLSAALRETCRQERVTFFMLMLGAFAVLLHRYSGQDDVIVGTNVANRNRREVEDLIGFFVNNLVLRCDLSGDPSFRELLTRVREVCLGGYAHQDVPFERLVEELQPVRDPSRSPLFQVMLVCQNTPQAAAGDLPGLELSTLAVDGLIAKLDLSLFVTDRPEGIELQLEYNTDLFDATTANRILKQLGVLLEGIAADLEDPISLYPLSAQPAGERQADPWLTTALDASF
jgi:amino acid adenylation domain-containing protein